MSFKYLHLCPAEKFIRGFIELIKEYLDFEEHEFIILDRKNRRFFYKIPQYNNVYVITSKLQAPILSFKMLKAKKIFIHGLWDFLVPFLYFQPWLYHKYYWIMWGGDFYFPEKQSKLKKKLIRRIKHFITYLDYDFKYIKKNYKAEGTLHYCFVYTNNVIDFSLANLELHKTESNNTNNKEEGLVSHIINILKQKNKVNILAGNSATAENNHFTIFEILKPYKDKINLIVPLSYGDKSYANKVIALGKKILGKSFIPLTQFLELSNYLKLLTLIDIAVFAHERQQAMGTTITLLGMGKKVFLRKNTSQWFLFNKIGVKIYDINQFSLDPIPEHISRYNIQIVKNYFSIKNLINQWKNILEGS